MLFEHRLGLALHKSRAEIRALPNLEFIQWKIFYALEPFGWGAHHALLYNINHDPKKSKAKDEDQLLADRAEEILKALQPPPDIDSMDEKEKRKYLIAQIKKDFRIK